MAWEHPTTPPGYRRLVWRRTIWVLSLGVPPVVALACIGHVPHAGTGFALVTVLVCPFLPWVVIAYFRRHRVAAVLQAYPWQEFPCRHPRRASGSPAAVTVLFLEAFTPTFRTIPFPVDLAEREDGTPDRIWFAGDPRFGGVVSPVGGHYPVRVVPHVPRREECGGDGFDLALRVGLVRRSGKATRT
ncbi:hypothetical protein ACWGHU_29050 [Streptomyces xanthophaeus]